MFPTSLKEHFANSLVSTISAFGDTPQEALEELKTAWELVKKDYREKRQEIPMASSRLKASS